MARRQKMTKKSSRRSFSKGAKVNRKNVLSGVMRGGIRM